MSKIRLLDLFEKPALDDLEKVYLADLYKFIYVPIDENFQPDDLFYKNNEWVSLSDYYGNHINDYNKKTIMNDLLYVIKTQKTHKQFYLRRHVFLKNHNFRYLREGDFLKRGDTILITGYVIDESEKSLPPTAQLLGTKYNDSIFHGPKFQKIIRRIELAK